MHGRGLWMGLVGPRTYQPCRRLHLCKVYSGVSQYGHSEKRTTPTTDKPRTMDLICHAYSTKAISKKLTTQNSEQRTGNWWRMPCLNANYLPRTEDQKLYTIALMYITKYAQHWRSYTSSMFHKSFENILMLSM